MSHARCNHQQGPLRLVTALGASLLLIAPVFARAAGGIDWSKVAGKEVVLFYPGQSSFEWMLTEDDHSGGPKIRKGKSCMECHEDEEQKIGELIVSGEKLEPTPIAGKRAVIPVTVKTAHDGERLYVRLQWPKAEGSQGEATDAAQRDPDHETKVAMLLADDSVRAAKLAGCWATCHDDLVTMPSDLEGEDLTKYLSTSRAKMSRSGGGTQYKADAELKDQLAQGAFMEYWQARSTGASGEPGAGYVLEERHEIEGDPMVNAEIEQEGGDWVAVLSRPLSVSTPGHKSLSPGTSYYFGLAIHDQHADKRFHHVSFEHTLRLNEGDADFVAKKP